MTFSIEMQGITIGALQLRFYSLMILLGMLAGIYLARRLVRRIGENPEHVVNIAVFGAVLGLVGARLYHVLDQRNWDYYQANPGQILAIWNGGIGIFGATAGALLALGLYAYWKRLDPLRWLDIGAPGFLLGQAIGRWGNFFNQELFGGPSDLPWAIPIRPENRPSDYLDVERFHPLFLYESLLSFFGVLMLVWLLWRYGPRLVEASGVRRLAWPSPRRLRPGDVLLLYFLWYPAERFALEFLRISPWQQGGVPMAQWVSGALFLTALGLLVWRHRRPWEVEAVPGGESGRSRAAMRRQQRRAERAE